MMSLDQSVRMPGATVGSSGREGHRDGATPVARALLAIFALGIPLDVMLSDRIGSTSAVLGSLLVAAAGIQVVASGRVRLPEASLSCLVAFTAWTAASVLWARDGDAFGVRALTGVQLLAFVALGWQILRAPGDVRAMLAGFLGGCVVTAVQVWRSLALGTSLYESGSRFTAEAFDPNDLAVTVALGIPVALYLGFRARAAWKVPLLAYVPLALSAIALSGSRGGTLTAATALVFALAWAPRRNRLAVALFVVTGGLLVALALRWVPEQSLARISTIREQLAGGPLGDRVQIWRAGLDVFREHPLLGVGAGNFPQAVAPALGKRMVAHNTMLSIAVELGVPGVLLFLGALTAGLRSVLRQPSDHRWLAWALAATWVVGTTSLTWEHRKTTWFVLLTIAALGRCATAPRGGGARWRRAPEIAGGTA